MEGGEAQGLLNPPFLWCHHGGVEEDSSGNLYNSGELMPKKVKAVLENNGGHTKYWHFEPNIDIFTYFCGQRFRH